MPSVRDLWRVAGLAALAAAFAVPVLPQTQTAVSVRGHNLTLRLYGPEDGTPVVVSSGDGGWIHLGPKTAEILARHGFRVTGVDSKAYLSAFTSERDTLAPTDVPQDYKVFVAVAQRRRTDPVVLIGVSEGAGLSVLAASAAKLQSSIGGVIGLGLPDVNELGWRFKDAIIYLTKRAPREPTFRTADYIPKLGVVPLAAIHSTKDEFVPLSEVTPVMALPGGPKKLWTIEAADHRFSDKPAEFEARLLEALAWVKAGGRAEPQ